MPLSSPRSRVVSCVSGLGASVSADLCAGLPMPSTTGACAASAAAPTAVWVAAPWSSCGAACGFGQRTRAVTCQSCAAGLAAVDSSLCAAAAKPAAAEVTSAPQGETGAN
jgi:hypothetical protein